MRLIPLLSLLVVGLGGTPDVSLESPRNVGGHIAFAFSPDGRHIVGGTSIVASPSDADRASIYGEVLLWDAQSGKCLRVLGEHESGAVDWVAFARDGEWALSGSRTDGTLRVWPTKKKGAAAATLATGRPYSRRVHPEVSPDGQTVVLVTEAQTRVGRKRVTRDSPLRVFDTGSAKERWSVDGPDVRAMAMDPKGRWIAVFTKQNWKNDGKTRLRGRAAIQSIELRDLASGRIVHTIRETWGVNALAFLPDGKSLAAATGSEMVFWSVPGGAEIERFSIAGESSPRVLSFDTDGRGFALSRFMGDRVEIWDLKTKRPAGGVLQTTLHDTVSWPAFSPELDRMACQRKSTPVVVDLTSLPKAR